MYKAYFDASFDNENKIAAMAYVIYNSLGNVEDKFVEISKTTDSDQAEWICLITLLKRLKQLGIREVEIYGDNKNAIDVANGVVWNKRSAVKYRITKHHSSKFGHISFNWISRKENKQADILSKSQKKELVVPTKHKNNRNTYLISPRQFDFNFKYKEKKRKVLAR